MDCIDTNIAMKSPDAASQPWRVIAAVADLMFTAKILAAAKQAGCPVQFIQHEEKLISAVPGSSCLVIVDLNHLTLDGVRLISRLKAEPATASIPVLGYLSHTQIDLKRAAEQAGCDLVLPRSVFSQNIHEILRRQSCHL
ncbi:MAG: response regulator [Acidobacteria bacterium]|nr:response regulator [Acidobacteriota bacterium]